jgi:membrane protein implicated in regulation of membrane protease activity
MLLVAAFGAVLNWPWWLEYVLIAPSAVWLVVSGRLVVYRQLNARSASSDRRVPVVLVVPVLLAAAIQATRYSGLVVVAAFAVVYIFSRHRTADGITSRVRSVAAGGSATQSNARKPNAAPAKRGKPPKQPHLQPPHLPKHQSHWAATKESPNNMPLKQDNPK